MDGKKGGGVGVAQGSTRRSVFGIFKRRAAHHHDGAHKITYPEPYAARKPSSEQPTTNSLSSLPVELLLFIITRLSFSDLLNLRSVCRETRDLLAKGDLLRQWMSSRALPCNEKLNKTSSCHKAEAEPGSHMRVYMKLYPPSDPVTLEYLLNQHRRTSLAISLATLLAGLMEEYVLKHPGFWTLEDASPLSSILFNTCPEYAQIQDDQVPGLLVVQHYLEILRGSMGELALSRFSDTTAIWSRVNNATFSKYDPTDLLSAHAVFEVLCWLMARLLDPSGYRARRVMVLSRRTLSDTDVRQFVVLGGLRGIAQLTRETSFKAREKLVKDLARSHDPIRNKQWRQAWSQFRFEYQPDLAPPQTFNVLNLEFAFHDVWFRAAVQHLAAHKLRTRHIDPLAADKPSRRTVDAYTDIAGYHMVQGRAW